MSYLNIVVVIVMCENLGSTEAVDTDIVKQILDRILKLGNTVANISLLADSFNCDHLVAFLEE